MLHISCQERSGGLSCEGRAPPQCRLGSSLAARSGAGSRTRESPVPLAARLAAGAALPGAGVRPGTARHGPARRGSRAAPPGERLPLDSATKGSRCAPRLLRERYLGTGWCGSGAQLGTASCGKQASLGVCALGLALLGGWFRVLAEFTDLTALSLNVSV